MDAQYKMPVSVLSHHHLPGKSHLKGPVLQSDQPRHERNKSRVKRYGIEVVKGLTWKGWEPGGEYTKNIVLKNVNVKTQKLTYRYKVGCEWKVKEFRYVLSC